MQNLAKHIAIKVATLVLVAALVAPSVVKFAHVFEHHKHVVCKGDNTTHFHQVDLECEFFKFQVNHQFIGLYDFKNLKLTVNQYQVPALSYVFLNKHKPLSFVLRGPPVLI